MDDVLEELMEIDEWKDDISVGKWFERIGVRAVDPRTEGLINLFKLRHDGRMPNDDFEKYCLYFLVILKPVYEENHRLIQVMKRKYKAFAEDKPEMKKLRKRESILERMSHILRKAVRIDLT